jgi:hypothetical protein
MSENAKAGLVEIYINDSEELIESEEEFVIISGKDLDLEIRLKGDYRIDSGDENLSVESIFIDVYFDSDVDRRDPTSGLPQFIDHDGLDPGYERFVTAFKGDDTRFEGYEGTIRFSIVMKNSSSVVVRDEVIIITMEAPQSKSEGSSGFIIEANPIVIGSGLLALIILGVGASKLRKNYVVQILETDRQRKDMEAQMKFKETQRKIAEEEELRKEREEELRKERAQERQAMRQKASVRERALDYDTAIGIWEELGQIDEAARVRKLKAEQNAVKIDQTVIHGDYVDDRDTIVRDSVINRSNVGSSSSKMQELEKLTEMKDQGIIDDDEFKQMKKEILGK